VFTKYIDGQYRRPTGLVGRWIGRKMAEQHLPENRWTVDLLDVQPDDHILEVGFGPGIALEMVLQHGARVSGVDFSPTMVDAARRRNRHAAGRIDLRHGDAEKLPFDDSTFDKAFSIHCIYFWKTPLQPLREIHRVLKPGGILILTVLPKERWVPEGSQMPLGTPDCKPYSGDELQAMLESVGFSSVTIKADTNLEHRSNYSVIGVKDAR
jgi:SAM-dependent methyltransferase